MSENLEDLDPFTTPPTIAAAAAAETGENANYVVELAVSLEKMFEDFVFFGTPTDDEQSIVADSTVIKMTVALSDDDNFEGDGTERSSDLGYYRERNGEVGNWDQSSFFANLTFLGEYVGIPNDCNSDGLLDVADLACVSTTNELDAVLADLNLVKGDLDGQGGVAFPDFLILSANFGTNVGSYVEGDIDLNGEVAFPDFLVLSANFGKGAGAVAAIPEPSCLALLGVGGLLIGLARGRK